MVRLTFLLLSFRAFWMEESEIFVALEPTSELCVEPHAPSDNAIEAAAAAITVVRRKLLTRIPFVMFTLPVGKYALSSNASLHFITL
jgi:hypothetical protein